MEDAPSPPVFSPSEFFAMSSVMKGQTWVKLVSAEIRGEMVKVD